MRIEDVRPVHVAGYIDQLQALRKAPTVKQHLACIRMLCSPFNTLTRGDNRNTSADWSPRWT